VLRFKIWHYSGTLLYERPWNKQEELWEVLWQFFPAGDFHEPMINYKPVEGIQPSQPQGELLRILFVLMLFTTVQKVPNLNHNQYTGYSDWYSSWISSANLIK
jgi:hypothetical protein